MAIKLEKLSLTWEEILDMDFARFSLAEVSKMSSEDKHELASLVHPNYDSWTWNDNLRKEAEKIWGEYK